MKVSFSISAKTGIAPNYNGAKDVAIKVRGGTITSSSFLMSKANKAICKAEVPELTAIAYLDLNFFENLFSNFFVKFPFKPLLIHNFI